MTNSNRTRVTDGSIDNVRAKVTKVDTDGRYGPFAIAVADGFNGSITFFLGDEDLWPEASKPDVGDFVLLSDLRKKQAGWRAMKARFFKPGDEPQATSNQQS